MSTPHQRYLLIVFANRRAQYVLNANDPHAHALKHKGYVFGDRLREELHPIVIR
jgi:hypothetical protein